MPIAEAAPAPSAQSSAARTLSSSGACFRDPHPVVVCVLEHFAEVLSVPTANAVCLFGLDKLFQRVGAGGLEQPVACSGISGIGYNQRASHKLRQQVDHRKLIDHRIRRDRRSSLEGEAAGKDRQAPQYDAFLFPE
ncbi:MAG: hypothetical protein E6H68_12745 [Betaproteobacteria bacterium]|nr:MAG: hypothetical protein E6H68_12745 [Betaproteobacteria bacterium]